ncbi:MAG TPA: hemerythrin domain-containing protein [Phenylobacterium sp.]|nr:hemerythrin domain-containing protein [Phenylobacterium sp.]
MSQNRPEAVDLPAGLMNDPIAWFLAEHHRHRQFCELMRRASTAKDFDEELVTWLLDFVVHELAQHVGDEEQDFFPMLRARALPEDEVDQVLGRLSDEHVKDLNHAHAVQHHLETCLSRRTPIGRSVARRRALEDFAAQELRHLALENAVVLPLARLRLTREDLESLSVKLAARRGLRLDPVQ